MIGKNGKTAAASTAAVSHQLAYQRKLNPKPTRKGTEIQPIVIQRGRHGVTQSENIAAVFHKQHKNVLSKIDLHIIELDEIGHNWRLYFKPRDYLDDRGKTHRSFELTHKGFDLLVLSFNGRKALHFKVAYIDQFHAYEQAALQEQANRLNDEWRESRAIGKETHREYTEQCKLFLEYASEQRGNNDYAKHFYCNLAAAKLKALFAFPLKIKPIRNLLSTKQLRRLEALDDVADVALAAGMDAALPYKDIYKLTVQAIHTDAALHGGVEPVVLG